MEEIRVLTAEEQKELEELLTEDTDSERLSELRWDAPLFLTEVDEEIVDVDEYYHTKDYIFKCSDGRYFCLRITVHSSMGDLESAYFYEVVPKEIKKIVYERKEN